LTGLHALDLIFDLDTEGDRQVASLRLLPADPILRLAEKSFEYSGEIGKMEASTHFAGYRVSQDVIRFSLFFN
jgi:hypothetical protein